jgi:hypothetical protein
MKEEKTGSRKIGRKRRRGEERGNISCCVLSYCGYYNSLFCGSEFVYSVPLPAAARELFKKGGSQPAADKQESKADQFFHLKNCDLILFLSGYFQTAGLTMWDGEEEDINT